MANNRMALVCKECNTGIAIAKFYPVDQKNPGWGQYPLNKDSVDYFFELHMHGYDMSLGGGNQYDLRYEVNDNTWEYDRLMGFQEYMDKQAPVPAFSSEAVEVSAEDFIGL